MRSILRNMAALAGVLMLTACVAGGGTSGKAGAPNPVTGDKIEVTALDAPPGIKPGQAKPADAKPGQAKPAPGEKPASPAGAKPGADGAAAPATVKPETGPRPKPKPEQPAETAVKEEIPVPEAAAPVPQEQKSAARLACEKRGDMWVKTGKSSVHTCVKRTRDSGKKCTNGTQCQGECLARSRTCSPYQPLFGCNEILQDNGVRMTLCLD